MHKHRLVYIFWATLFATLILFANSKTSDAAPSQQQVDQTRQFMEFVFGFKLDPPLVRSIQDGLAADLETNEAAALATLNDMHNVMRWVQSQPAAGGKLLRSYIEPELVATFQQDASDSSGTSKALVAAWRSHNQIIADGRPPLRRNVVQAYIAMFEFIAKQTGKPVPAQIAQHDKFSAHVAKQYAAAAPASQLKFNRVATAWLALQTMWMQSTPAQQAAFREQLRAQIAAPSSQTDAATPAPASQAGFSGQITDMERYNEKLFVDSEARVMMSTWTNPFSP